MSFVLDAIAASGSIAAAIIASFGLYSLKLASTSIKQTEHSLRFSVYDGIIKMCDEKRNDRHFLYDKVSPETPSAESVIELKDPGAVEKIDGVARTFDDLGVLVKNGAVPLEFVFDYYSAPIVVTWHRLQPYVDYLRNTKKKQLGHMKKFEILAIYCKKHRDKEHPGEETFKLSDEQKKIWRDWLKTIWFLDDNTKKSLDEEDA